MLPDEKKELLINHNEDHEDHDHDHGCVSSSLGSLSTFLDYLTLAGYPIAYAVINALLVEELAHYIDPKSKNKDADIFFEWKFIKASEQYTWGFFIALGAAIGYSVAMFYYKTKKHTHSAEAHGHSHSGHGSWEKFMHWAEHVIGLGLHNACFGIAGGYYAYLGDKAPANDEEKYIAMAICAVMAFFIARGEIMVHSVLLEKIQSGDANEDNHTTLGALQGFITAIGRQKTWNGKLGKAYINLGTLGSHICAGALGYSLAMNTIGLLFFGKIPSIYITSFISLGLGLFGAIVHTSTELQALEDSNGFTGILSRWKDIKNIGGQYKPYFIKAFLQGSFVFSTFHGVPEAIEIPSLVTPDDLALIWRILIVLTSFILLGIPDMLTFIPLVLDAIMKLFTEPTKEAQSSSIVTTPVLYGACSHAHEHGHGHGAGNEHAPTITTESEDVLQERSKCWPCFQGV